MSLEVPSFLKTEADSACSISLSASDSEDFVKYGFENNACDITLVDPSDDNITKPIEGTECSPPEDKEKSEDTEHVAPSVSTEDIIKNLGFSRTKIVNPNTSLLDEVLRAHLVESDIFFIFTDSLGDKDKDVLFLVDTNAEDAKDVPHMHSNLNLHLEIKKRDETSTTCNHDSLENQEATGQNGKMRHSRASNHASDVLGRNGSELVKPNRKGSETQRAVGVSHNRSMETIQDLTGDRPSDSHNQEPELEGTSHSFQSIFRPGFGIRRTRTQKIGVSGFKNLASGTTSIRRNIKNSAEEFNTPCKTQ